jgi:hypothetical protein
MWTRLMGAVALLASCALLMACGGGGGGGDDEPSGPARLRFGSAGESRTVIRGEVVQVPVNASVEYSGPEDIYLVMDESGGLIADSDIQVSENGLLGHVTLVPSLPPGVHETRLRLRACYDEACTRVAGSPAYLTIRLEMLPNIEAPPEIVLQRTGQEAPPTLAVPISVPEAAGGVRLETSGGAGALDVRLDGAQLIVNTTAVRAGTYTQQVVLWGVGNVVYRAVVEVRYVVHAPSGGERGLTATPLTIDLPVQQGSIVTQRFRVERATWTDRLDPLELADSEGMMSVIALGGDEYEVTFDSRGRAADTYEGTIRVSAGPTVEPLTMWLYARVGSTLAMGNDLRASLSNASTAADLRLSSPVVAVNGAPAQTWTARSLEPWLRVTRATGVSDVDALELEVDAALLPTLPKYRVGMVEISSDLPGTLPIAVPVGLDNEIFYLTRPSNGTVVGAQGRLYIDGNIPSFGGPSLLATGWIQLDGAQLSNVSTVTDGRLFGDVTVLRVDYSGATPGTPITVRAVSALLPNQLTLPVEAATSVPTAHLPLPFGVYRPLQYAPGHNAVYFAGRDTVYRWSHGAGGWQLTSNSLPGVIDVALRPDEAVLYATLTREVVALDPVTLVETRRGALVDGPTGAASSFNRDAPGVLRALAYSADLRAFATRGEGGISVGWLAGEVAPDIDQSPRWADPGSGYGGSGIVRSARGHTLLHVTPGAGAAIYRSEMRATSSIVLPNLSPVAVSDSAQTIAYANGDWGMFGSVYGNLVSLLPGTHQFAGVGLTGAGLHAVVYGYHRVDEGAGDRARDPMLWVIDLRGTPAVVASLPLPEAVGCTVPSAAGETCAHTASITVAVGDGSVFVAGPRGVAAIALPSSVAATASARPINRPTGVAPPYRRVLPVGGAARR